MSVLAIDAGTTGVTAVVVTAGGPDRGQGLPGVRPALPAAGLGRARARGDLAGHAGGHPRRPPAGRRRRAARRSASPTSARRSCSGTARRSGSPRRAIVWQDRRTADICTRLRDEGHEERVTELTGLRLDPYFSGHQADVAAPRTSRTPGRWSSPAATPIGTVDSYLIARMTRGVHHATDVSNASRTLLFDLAAGDWSDELCELFGVPRDALPELVPNWGEVATTDPASFLDLSLPIAGIAGDQQSALFGQTCFDEGDSKCTYGTGSFILTNTGTSLQRSDAGLLSTAAWRSPDGDAHLRARGRDLRDRRGRAVAARRAADRRVGRRDRGDRGHRVVLGGRGLRARAHRPRRPALGPARPRPDHRPDPRHHPRPHRAGDARGDRVRGARRAGDDAGASSPRCGSTAAPRPTTCSARSRPTSSAYPSSGRSSWRPPPSARRSWPGSAPASGSPRTSCARPGSSTARSTPPATVRRRRRTRALDRRRRTLQGLGRRWLRCEERELTRDAALGCDRRATGSSALHGLRGGVAFLVAARTASLASAFVSSASPSSSSMLLVGLLEVRELALELVDLGLHLHRPRLELLDVGDRLVVGLLDLRERLLRGVEPLPGGRPAPSRRRPGRGRRAGRAAPAARRRAQWPRSPAPPVPRPP